MSFLVCSLHQVDKDEKFIKFNILLLLILPESNIEFFLRMIFEYLLQFETLLLQESILFFLLIIDIIHHLLQADSIRQPAI